LIRYHHGQLTIVDREGLEAMACECHRIDHDRLHPAALMAARPFGRVEKFAAFVRQRTDKQQPWRHSLKSDVER
jgi:hypothetical protein